MRKAAGRGKCFPQHIQWRQRRIIGTPNAGARDKTPGIALTPSDRGLQTVPVATAYHAPHDVVPPHLVNAGGQMLGTFRDGASYVRDRI